MVITISVPEEGNVGVHTRAEAVAEAQVRPMLDRAVAALKAEREALEACPYHRRAEPLTSQSAQADGAAQVPGDKSREAHK